MALREEGGGRLRVPELGSRAVRGLRGEGARGAGFGCGLIFGRGVGDS